MHTVNLKISSVLLLSLFFQSATRADQSQGFWQFLNGAGIVGSLGSFAYWTPKTVSYIGQHGFKAALSGSYIPRLMIDALCVAGDCYDNNGTTTLNILCLLGSLGSLAVWAPSIIKNSDNPLYIARAVIDLIQIALASKRLFGPFKSGKTRKTLA